jgi:putative membrane protein
MRTLVVCVDRNGDIPRQTGLQTPVAGWEAVQSLVVEMGIADPEDSAVNTLLEALRVTRDLRDGEDDAVVAAISGSGDTVSADRSVADQLDDLIERYDPDSAVVVIDSAEDERVVPIVESRLQVDAVDRVVVRQARDLESTYYLLKQFLADEELRQTVLVPLGIVLLVFPALMMVTGSLAVAVASITAVIGLFVLYKGLSIENYLAEVPAQARDALYSGRVSIVTYVVAGGLALVGVFAGALGISDLPSETPLLLTAMAFTYYSVPWITLGGLAASAGRLFDEFIRHEEVRTSFLNLPFGVLAVGLVVRGFSAYFMELAGELDAVAVPAAEVGALSIEGFVLSPEERLAAFVVAGVLVSIIGLRVATRFSDVDEVDVEDGEEPVEP